MAAALATLSSSHARAHPSTSACAYDVSVRSVGQNGIYIIKPVTVTDVKSWNGFPNSVPARSLTVPCIGHGARLQQFMHHHWPA